MAPPRIEAAPILPRREAAAWARRIRRGGRRLVFTNGCFDLLHPGHLALLERARRLGDALLVGVNSDASVRRLKGPGRPLRSQRERCRILAAVRWVDAVVVFGEDTPARLIREVRPDVLVKGRDYRPEEVVGAEDVRSWGGRVVLVPLLRGYSTTRLLERLRRASP
jgi:D-beta-D-heptose 7-phosphate kinase/D-beta-D-heptose 1-phosphate adenosyltransferase